MALLEMTGPGVLLLKAGVPGRRIRITNYTVLSDKATTIQFLSNTTALTGAMPVALSGGISASCDSSSQLFITLEGEALNVGLGDPAATVAGHFEFLLD